MRLKSQLTKQYIYYIILLMFKRFLISTLCLLAFWLFFNHSASAEGYLNEPIFSPVAEDQQPYPPSKILYTQYLENGNFYLNQRLYEEAKQLFWKAIHLYPDQPDAYVNLGIVHMQQSELENALRIFKQAEGLSQRDYQQAEILFYNLGLCNFLKQDYPEAIRYLERALDEFFEFSQARYYLGLTHYKLNQYEDAFVNIFIAADQFQREGKERASLEAREFLRELETLHNVDQSALAISLLSEGRRALDNDKLDRAVYCLQESALVDPAKIDANYELALFYLEKESYHNAIIYLNKVIEADPNQIKAYLALSQAYRKIEKYDLAAGILESASRIDKENPSIYYHMALAYIEDQEFNTARRYLNEAQRGALTNKDDALLEDIQRAYLLIDEYKTAQAKPPHYPKKFSQKAALPLYPQPKVSGNAGYLQGGYFKPQELAPREEKRLQTTPYLIDY
ncbi:MAG: DUF3808 domain-containing protein [Candidatus Omnitrophica bacterium]|nr:DUF3808 domain-containing protein [Candidatus Omnitrophota bacterium]MBU2265568.1 DUF3808 domain-containing protein [Candidatus Omnitrophota bacterium]